MDPTLMVIGLNPRTAPVGVRERFWIGETGREKALSHLTKAEGVEEVVVLATCDRTEFLFWASDITLAANSLIRFLTAEYALKLCEWKHFARLLDEAALVHLFRVTASLESPMTGDPEMAWQTEQAWLRAQNFRTTGRCLDRVFEKALTVSERVRRESTVSSSHISIAEAVVALVNQVFEHPGAKKIVLIGAGKMAEITGSALISSGIGGESLRVLNRTAERADALAAKLGGTTVPFDKRYEEMADADIVISATSSPHAVLSRKEVARVESQQDRKHPLVIVDIAMPRDVDSAIRDLNNVYLFDLDDLEAVVTQKMREGAAAKAQAEEIVIEEARSLRPQLSAEPVVPTIVALRHRLDQICRQELESFRQENGPFSNDLEQILNAMIARTTQGIAGSLARELKELPERAEQEQMTRAVARLFHLPAPDSALAGAISHKEH